MSQSYRRYRLFRGSTTGPVFHSADRMSELTQDVLMAIHVRAEWHVLDAAKSMSPVPRETVLRVCGIDEEDVC